MHKSRIITGSQESIDRRNAAVKNGLPGAKKIFDLFNAIPGVERLTADSWISLFTNTQNFIEILKHGFQDGDIPDLDYFLAKLDSYINETKSLRQIYAPYNAYTVANGELVVNPAY